LIGDYHALTAAHCVTTTGGTFYTDWEFEAGKDSDGYRYYGVADWTTARFFSSYAPSGNFNFDMALITLDRKLGDYTGHLGYGYNSSNAWYTGQNAQNIGFPGDKPFGTMWQSVENPTSHSITTDQLRSNTMDTWFGNSGGPISYSNVAHGVVSHFTYTDTNGNGNWDAGEPPIYNSATRMTQTKFDAIGSWITADATPTDRADLVSWDKWFDSTNFDQASVSGNTFSVDTVIRNMGTAAAGSFTVRYRLSTDQTYDVSDIFLGDSTVTSLAPFNWTWNSLSASIPAAAVEGQSYYVVYTIDVNNDVVEFTNAETGAQNTGVVLTPLVIDRNDQISEATLITSSLTPGSIGFSTDVNMYRFFATAGSVIQVDTDMPGSTLDTIVRLFDSSGTQLDVSDDDVGPVPEYTIRESFFEYTITVTGTYYLGISAYSNFNYNPTTGTGDTAGGTTGTYELILDYVDPDDQISESTLVGLNSTTNGVANFGADVDMYRFNAIAGQWLDLDVDLPGSEFDSILRVFDSSGNQLAVSDDNAGPGTEYSGLESYLRFIAPSNGLYYLAVSVYSNFYYNPVTGRDDSSGSSVGNYQLHVLQAPATLVSRQVYYRGSTIPGGLSAHLDTSKVIAKQGGAAQVLGYNNIINHSRGITGMVFDYNGLPGEPLINSDFIFQWSPQGSFDTTLTANQPANWAIAPNPTLIDNSALTGSTRRMRLEWADNTILNRWLRVTIKANLWTGLTTPETYYLGHLTGEVDGAIGGFSGTLPNGRFAVNNLGDVAPVRSALGSSGLSANSIVDIDKSGHVNNLGDVAPVRANLGAQLPVITIPASSPAPSPPPALYSDPTSSGTSVRPGRGADGLFWGANESEDRLHYRTAGKRAMDSVDRVFADLESPLFGYLTEPNDSMKGPRKVSRIPFGLSS
jgi:V8-like Glu-specific endopeptidase